MTKYFTFDLLRKANRKARRYNLNRKLEPSFFKEIDPEKVYPVSFTMIHNDDHMRVRFVHNGGGYREGSASWIDMTLEDYNALPAA